MPNSNTTPPTSNPNADEPAPRAMLAETALALGQTLRSRQGRADMKKLADQIATSQETLHSHRSLDGSAPYAHQTTTPYCAVVEAWREVLLHLQHQPALQAELLRKRWRAHDAVAEARQGAKYYTYLTIATLIVIGLLDYQLTHLSHILRIKSGSGIFSTSFIDRLNFHWENLGWYSLGLIGFILVLSWFIIRLILGTNASAFFLGSLPWIGGQYRLRSMADTFDVVSTLLKTNLNMTEAFRLAGATSELILARQFGLQITGNLAQSMSELTWAPAWIADYFQRVEGQQPLSQSCEVIAMALYERWKGYQRLLMRMTPIALVIVIAIGLEFSYSQSVLFMIYLIRRLSSGMLF